VAAAIGRTIRRIDRVFFFGFFLVTDDPAGIGATAARCSAEAGKFPIGTA